VDTVNNEILVANFAGDSITVYSRTATGNAAPLRTLSGAATGLSGSVDVNVATNPPIPIIPTLTEWAQLGLAGLLMVASALLILRRRSGRALSLSK
jgi:hypothetical protein